MKTVNFFLTISLIFLLSNCGYYVMTDKIKLENFPQDKSVKKVNVHMYVYENNAIEKIEAEKYGFKKLIFGSKQIRTTSEYNQAKEELILPKSGCVMDVSLYNSEFKWSKSGAAVGIPLSLLSMATLSIIPVFSSERYWVDGKLIDAKTKNIIKEYHYEDDLQHWHWLFGAIFVNPSISTDKPKVSSMLQNKLHEALFRQVTNDVQTIKECQY